MNPLDDLALRLQDFTRRPGESVHWRDPAMSEALARIRQSFAERLAERDGPRANRSLLAFRLMPQQIGAADLALVCRNIARPADWEGRCLIDDEHLMLLLLARVSILPQTQWLQCYRALDAARQELKDASVGASELAIWLDGGLPRLRALQNPPGWVVQLLQRNHPA